jgi:hypothetical protein
VVAHIVESRERKLKSKKKAEVGGDEEDEK